MRFSGFFAHFAVAFTVLSASVGSLAALPSAHIFPLYIYPGEGCSNWAPLFSAISAYPALEFILVIDPDSGPGLVGSQPDANYQACITQLRNAGMANENVEIIGYVATGYGFKRTSSDVTMDIDTYAGWAEAYHMEGIFFDEAANDFNMVSKYQNYASYARTKLGSDAYIVLNPGIWNTSSSPDYFSFADLIVTFENTYGNFTTLAFPTGASTPASQQAAIIHTGPMSAPIDMVQAITQTMGLGASFYSNFPNKTAYIQFPTNWKGFLDELVSTQAS